MSIRQCPGRQLDLLGVEGGETSSSEIMAIGEWRTNGALIADAARLGYIAGKVLDLTYGEGKFWTDHRPEDLTTNDLNPDKPAQHHFDATGTPWEDRAFDTVVFDPPYKLAGTPSSPEMDHAYGTTAYVPRAAAQLLLVDGITEGARLTRRLALGQDAGHGQRRQSALADRRRERSCSRGGHGKGRRAPLPQLASLSPRDVARSTPDATTRLSSFSGSSHEDGARPTVRPAHRPAWAGETRWTSRRQRAGLARVGGLAPTCHTGRLHTPAGRPSCARARYVLRARSDAGTPRSGRLPGGDRALGA